ncbi:MAG TPA: nucleotidyltransferase family protein, partial [Thermoanaerobaculia bacterium]|nr:nucleotidyltransferase family protein [Thermoanaerobaculia bacterium]
DRRFFAELSRLQGEEGGRDLLSRHPEQLVELELESEAPLLDLDAAEDENRLRRERQPPSGA